MGLSTVAYEVIRIQSSVSQAPNSSNTVQIQTTDYVPHGYWWSVTAVTVTCQNSSGATYGSPGCSVFDQDPSGFPVPCNSTVAGVLDTDNSGTLLIAPGDRLYLVFYNVPIHGICKARIQYEKVQVVDVARPLLG